MALYIFHVLLILIISGWLIYALAKKKVSHLIAFGILALSATAIIFTELDSVWKYSIAIFQIAAIAITLLYIISFNVYKTFLSKGLLLSIIISFFYITLNAFLILPSLSLVIITGAKISQSAIMAKAKNIEANSVADMDGLVDIRGQLHVHCYRSHDSEGKLEEIVEAAKSAGIQWIILTDHKSDLPKFDSPINIGNVLIIFGSESDWRRQGSALKSSLNNPENGLVAYGHIEKFSGPTSENWDAIEIVNFHANSFAKGKGILGKLLFANDHCYEELMYIMRENLNYWQMLSEQQKRPIPIFAGPDSHSNVKMLGMSFDPYDLMLRLVSTHIFLSANEKLTEDSIVKAIKDGRTYVCFDVWGNSTGFQFSAAKNNRKFFTGSVINQPDNLIVKNPLTHNSEIRIFKDNILVAQKFNSPQLTIEHPKPGFWRTEIYLNNSLWIIGGQILITEH